MLNIYMSSKGEQIEEALEKDNTLPNILVDKVINSDRIVIVVCGKEFDKAMNILRNGLPYGESNYTRMTFCGDEARKICLNW